MCIVFVISNEPWGDVWFSKQHYAYELSKLGHQVYFINPVSRWYPQNIFSYKIETTTIKQGLTVINYKNNLPVRFFPKLFLKLNDKLNTYKLKRLYKNKESVVWWQFDCFRFAWLNKTVRNHKRIYHVVDPYMHTILNKKIALNANLIVCTSTKYLEYYKTHFRSKKVIHIPHGISDDEFTIDELNVNQIKNKYGNFMLLVSTISRTINFDLLEKILENSTIPLLFIGKIKELPKNQFLQWRRIKEHKNTFLVGIINAKELKNWISASKICIVTYKYELPHQSSLKIIHYLAGRRPIVSSLTGEFIGLNNEGIFHAKNDDEFLELLSRGVKDELHINQNKINVILKNRRYETLIINILCELNS